MYDYSFAIFNQLTCHYFPLNTVITRDFVIVKEALSLPGSSAATPSNVPALDGKSLRKPPVVHDGLLKYGRSHRIGAVTLAKDCK
jgi:hypothetical protein